MSDMMDEEILNDFLTETNESMERLDQEFLGLEERPKDPALINSIFRTIHTVKGTSGFLGLSKLEGLAHITENILVKCRDGKMEVTPDLINLLLKSVDSIKEIMSSLGSSRTEGGRDISGLLEELNRTSQGAAAPGKPAPGEIIRPAETGGGGQTREEPPPSEAKAREALSPPKESMDEGFFKEFLSETNEDLERLDREFLELEKNPADSTLIKNIFRRFHTTKASAGFLGFSKLEAITHITEDILAKCREGEMSVTPGLINLLLNSVDSIKAIMGNIGAGRSEGDKDISALLEELNRTAKAGAVSGQASKPEVKAEVPVPSAPKTEAAPPPVKKTASPSVQKVTAPPPQKEPAAPVQAAPAEVHEAHPAPEADSPAPSGASAVAQADTTVRVNIELLDSLMNLVGELVLARNQLLQNLQSLQNNDLQILNQAAQKLNLVTTELQMDIMKTRMQPIGNVFNKFPRVVRDLAKSNGKLVRLTVEGQGTEVDKTLLEAIKDPLMHIVRNSIDHGIEAPGERQKNNKPADGQLFISAYHESGQVVIEIKDDGGGINPIKVRAKAIEKGIISPAVADKMSDKELQMLIFRAGFSTAEKVTNISGRGVGMDVVKTNIEKVGGLIEVISEAGKGTTLKLRIPLTLAIIPTLIILCRGERYAIPQVNLLELVFLEGEAMDRSIEKMHGTEVYRLRENLLPLIRLRNVLQLPPKERSPNVEDDYLYIAVLQSGSQVFGLILDDILDSEEIVVKPLVSEFKKQQVYAGATILGDGQVAMILDVAGILKNEQIDIERISEEARAEEDEAEVESQTLLLFRVNEKESFGIPLLLISRIEEISRDQIKTMGGKEMISYFNSLIPLIRLEKYLDITPPAPTDSYSVIVFNFNNKKVGLLANFLDDAIETYEQVDTSVFHEGGVLGAMVVNEKAILLIDIYKIIEKADPSFFEKKEEEKLPKNLEDYKILLVEDSPFFLNLEKNYLESEGFVVLTAMDGLEGLAVLEKEDVDMIVTDLEMPRMDGFAFVEEVRKKPVYKSMPIMAVTSLAGEKDREKALRAGVDDYQIKMDREELVRAAKKLLAEGRRV
ncbi:MAG: chemotaxis protein CheW [Nitrospinae bacterium]|nr:chemotaxis protein CheW [Nitrospinota bacterium]